MATEAKDTNGKLDAAQEETSRGATHAPHLDRVLP